MLFLLRKIRRKLIADNKIKSYLLYAVGEIFLVVIGIMIAVSLNNWNEQRKLKETTKVLFRQIQMDILSNMEVADRAFRAYNTKDSIFWTMKQKQLTASDFQGEEGRKLKRAINTFSYLRMSNSGFEALKEHPGLEPGEFAELINDLTHLEEEIYFFNDIDKGIIEARREHMDYRRTTFDWYSSDYWTGEVSETELEFYASNPRLKNYIALYAGLMRQSLICADFYTRKALETYRSIAHILGQDETELPDQIRHYYSDLPSDSLKHFLGTYVIHYVPPITQLDAYYTSIDSVCISLDEENRLNWTQYSAENPVTQEMSIRSANLLEIVHGTRVHFSLDSNGYLREKLLIGPSALYKKVRE